MERQLTVVERPKGANLKLFIFINFRLLFIIYTMFLNLLKFSFCQFESWVKEQDILTSSEQQGVFERGPQRAVWR